MNRSRKRRMKNTGMRQSARAGPRQRGDHSARLFTSHNDAVAFYKRLENLGKVNVIITPHGKNKWEVIWKSKKKSGKLGVGRPKSKIR